MKKVNINEDWFDKIGYMTFGTFWDVKGKSTNSSFLKHVCQNKRNTNALMECLAKVIIWFMKNFDD